MELNKNYEPIETQTEKKAKSEQKNFAIILPSSNFTPI